MSASTIVTIMCDEESCGEWWDLGTGDTATMARKKLRKTGWLLNVRDPEHPHRRDFCPRHA